MREAEFEEVEVYIAKQKNTVAQYIETRMILDLCTEVERRLGASASKWWWDQAGIYLTGAWEALAEVEGEEAGTEGGKDTSYQGVGD